MEEKTSFQDILKILSGKESVKIDVSLDYISVSYLAVALLLIGVVLIIISKKVIK